MRGREHFRRGMLQRAPDGGGGGVRGDGGEVKVRGVCSSSGQTPCRGTRPHAPETGEGGGRKAVRGREQVCRGMPQRAPEAGRGWYTQAGRDADEIKGEAGMHPLAFTRPPPPKPARERGPCTKQGPHPTPLLPPSSHMPAPLLLTHLPRHMVLVPSSHLHRRPDHPCRGRAPPAAYPLATPTHPPARAHDPCTKQPPALPP